MTEFNLQSPLLCVREASIQTKAAKTSSKEAQHVAIVL